jgi:hypothetical protein
MDLYKFGVKIFLAAGETRATADFITIFQGWIQRQALPGHLLIDVHDYSHVPQGPGILLVAHEANLSLDESGGRRGLVYIRKQPAGKDSGEALLTTVQSARAAAKLLEEEQDVKFDFSTLEVFVNDRLHAPNDKTSADKLLAPVARIVGEAFGVKATATVKPTDPRERLTFVVKL